MMMEMTLQGVGSLFSAAPAAWRRSDVITEEVAKPQRNLLPCLPGPNQWTASQRARLPIHHLSMLKSPILPADWECAHSHTCTLTSAHALTNILMHTHKCMHTYPSTLAHTFLHTYAHTVSGNTHTCNLLQETQPLSLLILLSPPLHYFIASTASTASLTRTRDT